MRCSHIFLSHRRVSPFSRGLIFTRARVRSLYYPWGKMETTRSIPKGWTERFLLWPIDLSFSFGRAPTSFSGSSPTHSSEREDPGNEGGNSAWLQSGTSWVRFRADKHVPVVVRSPGLDQYQGLKITGKWRYFLCLQMARPSRGSDDYEKWRFSSPEGVLKVLSTMSTFSHDTLVLKLSTFCFCKPDYLHSLPPVNGPQKVL